MKKIELLKIVSLRVMNQTNYTFIGTAKPELSWQLFGFKKGLMQQAYQIKAASKPELLPDKADLWDSGKVISEQSLHVRWEGSELKSRQKVFFQVMAWDNFGNTSQWSDVSHFEIALLEQSDWQAQWISYVGNNPAIASPCPYFRKEFSLRKTPRTVKAYVTARGLFEMEINGKQIGNDCFVPGWTDYHQRQQYLAYDVTSYLSVGPNALAAICGDGWYCGHLSTGKNRNHYGKYPEFLLQLEIEYLDASTEIITTDSSWQTTTGPILYSDIYDGEMYNAQLEMPGYSLPEFDDHKWKRVRVHKLKNTPILELKCAKPVRKIMEITPVSVREIQAGVHVFDLGQNISGFCKIEFNSVGNRLFTARFAEMLNSDGTLYNQNYRSARSTDYYVTRSYDAKPCQQVWEPHFTFHGFRYVEVSGIFGPKKECGDLKITGIVLHSDLEITGNIITSDKKINQLYNNICWGQRGNFFEIPTDCPQRDERLGWTGDAQIFIDTASFNMNVSNFFEQWLRCLREAQTDNGAFPDIAPDIFEVSHGKAAWADAGVICPWNLYLNYGNIAILESNFEAMCNWMKYQQKKSNEFIRPELGYGDWLATSDITTPRSLVGTAYFAYTAAIMSQIAKLLNKPQLATHFTRLHNDIKAAFNKKYIDKTGQIKIKSQTACIMALAFDLLDKKSSKITAELLAELVIEAGNKLTTGFVGTGLIMSTLSKIGRSDLAYSLLLQEEYPSWLFSVNQGATTIWERWNSYTIKDGFGPVSMNSFNHYAYGAVGSWIAHNAAGINYVIEQPGAKTLLFKPEPDPRLNSISAKLMTPYGEAVSEWKYTEKSWSWNISAPPNTKIRVVLPFGNYENILLNDQKLQEIKNFKIVEQNGQLILALPNGQYSFYVQ